MKHSDVIKPEFIEQYVETHKMLYSTLSIMISDISFIEACINLQDGELGTDWISIRYLYRSIFETLILRTYRCFFDNSGKDSTNIFKFKNDIIADFLKDEYRDKVKGNIKELKIEDKIYKKSVLPNLKKNVSCLRDKYIAHGILNDDTAEVNLQDIKELLNNGCELFQALSFEPKNFYTFFEGDGYDFSREIAYTQKSLENIIKYTMLSSNYIKSINCTFAPDSNEYVKKRMGEIVDEINRAKE